MQSPGALMRIGPRNNDSMTVATGERAVARRLANLERIATPPRDKLRASSPVAWSEGPLATMVLHALAPSWWPGPRLGQDRVHPVERHQ